MKRIIQTVFLLFLFSTSVFSQNLQFKQFTVEDGLPQNSIFSIVQDCTGFMWFGTADGLSRYDGHSFKNFRTSLADSTSLPDNKVVLLSISNQKKMMLSSTQNLVEFNKETETFSTVKIPDLVSVYSLFPGGSTFLKKDGFYFYDFENKLLSPLKINSTLEETGYFFEINDSLILTVKSTEIVVTGKSGFKRKLIGNYRKKFYSLKYLILNDSTIIIGMMDKNGDADLYQINTNKLIAEKLISFNCDNLQQSDKILTSFTKENNHLIWITVHHFGLLQIDLRSGKIKQRILKNENGLTTDLLVTSYIDKSRNLWIGTDVSGIFKADLKQPKFKLIKAFSNNKIDNLTKAIYTNGNQYLWLGSFSSQHGLIRYDLKTYETKTFSYSEKKKNSLSDNKIVRIAEGKENQLWITTERGLDLFDTNSGRSVRFNVPDEPDLTQNACIWIGEDKKKSNWILSHRGIGKLDREKNKITYVDDFKPSIYNTMGYWNLSAFFETDSTICFTSNRGLGIININSEKTNYINKLPGITSELTSFKPKIIYNDSKKRVWIGTENGLLVWDRKTNQCKLFTELDGLSNTYIYGLVEDKNHHLWISTNKGLSTLNLNRDVFKTDQNSTKQEIRNYDVTDGLQSNEFNSGAVFKDKNEVIYFAGIGGITYFHPDSVSDNPFKPEIVLSDVKLFNQTVKMDSVSIYKKQISLHADENTISFEFASLEFTNPEKNKFAYKLENFDNDWIYSGTKHDVRYTNLFPGQYVFKVKGANNDGVWNETGTSISLIIVPPFWQTWWFGIFSVSVLLGLVYLSFRITTNLKVSRKLAEIKRAQEMETERQKERNRISRDMHDEVGSGLTKIALLSKSILSDKDSTENRTENIRKVNETASHLVDNIGEIIWAIDPKNDSAENLAGYFRKYASDYFDDSEIKVEYDIQEISQEKQLSAETRRNLFLTFKEALNNCLKHSSATHIRISLSSEMNEIKLKISDNGNGFNPNENKKYGNGLLNMKKRMEDCGGNFAIESEANKGTVITVSVPVKILHSGH